MTSPESTVHGNDFASERRALGMSMICGLVLAAIGIAIGVFIGSQIILFDGFYTFLGIGLSWMAYRVSHLVASGPTSRYPFGREALTPLIIGVEAVALLATCAYATFNAVLTIVDGGAKLPASWGVGYAGAALVVPIGLWWWMRRTARTSELVAAEATQWLAGGALGLAMLVAFLFAHLIIATSWARATRYVDPSLVIVACLAFAVPPLRMVRTTFVELVEGSPPAELARPTREAVNEVAERFGLGDQHLRMSKVGRKFYVEVDFVVDDGWTVRQSDQVRHAINERLAGLPHDLWLTVEFTADRTWGA
jgi:predicted Co/Zn/Cd cation transporter (cation efflux family)